MGTPTLVLIGLRGSGKTTVGRLLATRLQGREADGPGFVDLDDRTPAVLGCDSVADAWEAHGESAFRDAEMQALGAILSVDDKVCRVLALGGGTPTAPGAEAMLASQRDRGRVVLVYLRAMPDTLRERLSHADNRDRPALLGGKDPLDEIDAVFARRDPLYRQLATVEVACDGMSAKEVADLVAAGVGL